MKNEKKIFSPILFLIEDLHAGLTICPFSSFG